MLYLPVTILLALFSVLMFIHTVRSWNSETKTIFKKINEIIYALLVLSFGLYYPLLILRLGKDHAGILFPTAVEELTFLGNFLIIGIATGIALWGISAKIRTIRNPELLKNLNCYENFKTKFISEYPNKNHYKRKITHIFPVVVVAGCAIIFYNLSLFDGAWIDYALFFSIIIGVGFASTFIIEDLIRLFDFSYMPPNAIKLCEAALTPDELDSFSSTSVMIFSFGPFLFFSFPIFFCVITVTAVADAMASIFGIAADNKGIKHTFPKWSDKSIEGYIGGILSTFLCVVGSVAFSNLLGLSNWSTGVIISLALILSVEFFLIDFLTTKIKLQDNFLNPFIMGFSAVLYLMALNIAIV